MSDEKKLSFEDAKSAIESCYGFDDTTTPVGEAWAIVNDKIAALEQRLAEAEADLSRLNVVADTVCHDPQGIGPSAVMFKQCKRIAELERELAEARKDAERLQYLMDASGVFYEHGLNYQMSGRLREYIDAEMLADAMKENAE